MNRIRCEVMQEVITAKLCISKEAAETGAGVEGVQGSRGATFLLQKRTVFHNMEVLKWSIE